MMRESLPLIVLDYRRRNIKPDQVVQVKQGQVNLWYCTSMLVGELLIGERLTDGRITTPGAIQLLTPYAYRNTSSPQDIADDIYSHNHGDSTVPELIAMPSQAAAILGSITSARKAKSSARNGRLGGRPRKKKGRKA